MQDPQTILTQVLTIIDYNKDKQEFINNFNILVLKRAVTTAAQKFDDAKQKEFFEALMGKNDPQSFKETLNKYLSDDEYNTAVQNASAELFEDFLKSIDPKLTPEQSDALDAYLATLDPEQTPPSTTPHSQP